MLPTNERFRGPPYSYSPLSVHPMNATTTGLRDPRSDPSGAAPPVDVSRGSVGTGTNHGVNVTDDQLLDFVDCLFTDRDVKDIEQLTCEQPAAKRQKVGDSTPPTRDPPPSGLGEGRAVPPASGAFVAGRNQRARAHSLELEEPKQPVMDAADVSARVPPQPRLGREGPFAFRAVHPRRAVRVVEKKDVTKEATKAKDDGTGQTDTAAMAMLKKALIEGQPALSELRAILAKTEGGFADFQRVFEAFKHSISARRNDLGVTKVRASKRENRRDGTVCSVLDEKIIPTIGDHVGRSEKYYGGMYPSLPEQDMVTMVRRTIKDALEDNVKAMEGLSKGIPLAAISSCPDRTAWIKQYVMNDMWSMLTDDVYYRIHMCIYGKGPTEQAQKK